MTVEKLVIIGSGVAGLSAALYTARASAQPVVVDGSEPGGQLGLTSLVENYPGFPDGIEGPELIQRMRQQAERFGARYVQDNVRRLDLGQRPFTVELEYEEPIQAHSVIIASGARARLLGLPGEQQQLGRGVSTCAVCDGAFYKGKNVMVVGGGDSAMEDSTFLTRYASSVTVVHHRDQLRASVIMQERARSRGIRFMWNTRVVGFGTGERGLLNRVTLKDTVTGEEREEPVDGLFLAIGHLPNTEMLDGQLDLDERGFIRTEGTRTRVKGVFVAGDVADALYQQAVTAAGSGCQAALEAEEFLQELGI